MDNPDFVKIAEAYHIPARKSEKREDLQDAIKEMLAAEGPFFLEAVVGKEDNVFPMVPAGAGCAEILLEAPKRGEGPARVDKV